MINRTGLRMTISAAKEKRNKQSQNYRLNGALFRRLIKAVAVRRNRIATVSLVVLTVLSASFPAQAVKPGLRFWPMILNYSEADSKGGVTMNVMNNTKNAFLLKASMSVMDTATGQDSKDQSEVPPFVVLPPLTRMEPWGQYAFRVRQVGEVPQDRESACLVSITAIPGTNESLPVLPPLRAGRPSSAGEGQSGTDKASVKGGGVMQVALKMNMRLFYRPAGIPPADYRLIASKLVFQAHGKSLRVENPTPYFLHFSRLEINGKPVRGDVLAPYIEPKSNRVLDVSVPVNGDVTWRFSDDAGMYKASINKS